MISIIKAFMLLLNTVNHASSFTTTLSTLTPASIPSPPLLSPRPSSFTFSNEHSKVPMTAGPKGVYS